jgi:hypothetical protein
MAQDERLGFYTVLLGEVPEMTGPGNPKHSSIDVTRPPSAQASIEGRAKSKSMLTAAIPALASQCVSRASRS